LEFKWTNEAVVAFALTTVEARDLIARLTPLIEEIEGTDPAIW
jgi:hypothetical protein